MSPEEKAKDLMDKFEPHSYEQRDGIPYYDEEKARELSIICVDELISLAAPNPPNSTLLLFWVYVKKELESI